MATVVVKGLKEFTLRLGGPALCTCCLFRSYNRQSYLRSHKLISDIQFTNYW